MTMYYKLLAWMKTIRVARWFIFKPNPHFWYIHFGSPLNGKFWYPLRPFRILCGHLLYSMPIWHAYVMLQFWYVASRKNQATLEDIHMYVHTYACKYDVHTPMNNKEKCYYYSFHFHVRYRINVSTHSKKNDFYFCEWSRLMIKSTCGTHAIESVPN
jgi:hypothetical protein